jgi:hypothetical protein
VIKSFLNPATGLCFLYRTQEVNIRSVRATAENLFLKIRSLWSVSQPAGSG